MSGPEIDELRRRLRAIDERRRALLDDLERLDDATLQARPGPGRWSIQEVVEHLVLAERYVFRDMPDRSALQPSKRAFLNRLLYLLVLFILYFGVPVRAPARSMLPQGRSSLRTLRDMWDENYEWLRAWVSSLRQDELKLAFFRHPVTGALTTRQAIRLLDVHLRRHAGQIRKLQSMQPVRT